MYKTFISKLIILILILFNVSTAYAQESAGVVVDVSGGSWVERDGSKTALRLKTPIFATDTIATDNDGSVQILFNDDTSLMVGKSSIVRIDDFVFDTNGQANFAMSAVKGVSRVITGKIVEQNSEGFKVSTPLATVGIRGTGVTFSVDQIVSVLLDHIGEGKDILITNLNGEELSMDQAGYMLEILAGGGFGQLEQITPEQLTELLSALGLVISDTGDSASEEEGDSQSIASFTTEETEAIDAPAIKAEQDAADYLSRGETVVPTTAVYQSAGKRIGFKVDLLTGKASDAYFTHITDGGLLQAYGGTGQLTVGEYTSGYIKKDVTLSLVDGYSYIGEGVYSDTSQVAEAGMVVNFHGYVGHDTSHYASAGYNIAFGSENITGGDSLIIRLSSGDSFVRPELDDFKTAVFANDDQLSQSGFVVNLISGDITEAYYVHTDWDGTVYSLGGEGTLTSANVSAAGVHVGASANVGGFDTTVGLGKYNTANISNVNMNVSFEGGDVAYVARPSYSFTYNGEQYGSEGFVSVSQHPILHLPTGSELEGFNTVYYNNGTNSSPTGFTINFNTGAVTDAYFAHVTGKGALMVAGGTGSLDRSNNSITLDFTGATITTTGMYNASTITDATLTTTLLYDEYATTPPNFTYTEYGQTVRGEEGKNQAGYIAGQLPDVTDFYAVYTGELTETGGTLTGEFGFALDIISGVISNMYIATNDTAGGTMFTNGVGTTGILGGGGDIIVDTTSFNNDAGIYVLDSFTATMDSGTVNVTEYNIRETINSYEYTGIGTGDVFTGAHTLAYFKATESSVSTTEEIGFVLDTATGMVSDAYVYSNEYANDVYYATGGSGYISAVEPAGPVGSLYIDDFVNHSAGYNASGGASSDVSVTGSKSEGFVFSNITANISGVSIGGFNSTQLAGASEYNVAKDLGEKKATYSANNISITGGDDASANAGFNVDFLTSQISGAYLHVTADDNAAINFDGGSGVLGAIDASSRPYNLSVDTFTTSGNAGTLSNATLNSFSGTVAERDGTVDFQVTNNASETLTGNGNLSKP